MAARTGWRRIFLLPPHVMQAAKKYYAANYLLLAKGQQ